MFLARNFALFLAVLWAAPLAGSGQNQAKPPAPSPFGGVPEMSAAQRENFPAQLLDDLGRIKDAALSDDYAYQQAAHLTDNIGPRPSGSLEAQAAVDYVAGELRKLGCDVQLEAVTVPHWVRGAERAELVAYPGQTPAPVEVLPPSAVSTIF